MRGCITKYIEGALMGNFQVVSFTALILCISGAQATESPTELSEIVVTAQKVTENLREVPISVSVLDSGELQNQHIADIADLTRAVPNFSFTSNGNPGGAILEMRGISSAAGASPVAIYLDDVSITQRTTSASVGQPEPVLLDVQQVEVLRGPQGTLYGASAEAGVLKFRTNPVDLSAVERSALAETSGNEHGGLNYRANGVFNAPIVDGSLGIRFAAESDRASGFIDRVSPEDGALLGSGINDNESSVARMSVESKPSEQLTVIASIFYQRSIYGSTNTVTLGLPALETNNVVPDNGANTLIIPSLTITYDTGWADFTSVTSDYTRNAPFNYDGTVFNSVYIAQCYLEGLCGSPLLLDLHGNQSGAQIAALPSPGVDGFFTRQFSQELRLNSKPYTSGGSPVTWVAGLYYQGSTDRLSDYEYIPGFNTLFTSLYGTAALNNLFGGPLPDDLVFFGGYRFVEKQYSEFGDLTFHVNDALRFSAGLRYLTASQNVDRSAGGFFNGGNSSIALASKDHAITPKFSIGYDLNQQVTGYVTASKGFRLGGPNTPVISFCDGDLAQLGLTAAPASYGHDSLWNYELGVKARPTARLSINSAIFYDKWSQLQQSISLPDCGSGFTTNLGAAKAYGAETDVTALVLEGLTATLSGGYTHANLTQAIPSMDILAGARVEGVPDWSSNASLEYIRPINASVSGLLRANYSYVGTSHGTLVATDPDYERPSYDLVGASIGARVGGWEVSLFAKNLFDNQKIYQTPSHATVPLGLVLTPRTIGVSATGKF
jgi:outer membrane receptor protein involved in Fe transport